VKPNAIIREREIMNSSPVPFLPTLFLQEAAAEDRGEVNPEAYSTP